MSWIFTWFMTTRIGRGLALAFAVFIALSLAALRIFSAGRQVERTKQNEQSIKALRERNQTDDKIAKMPDAAVRSELSEWVQRDD